MLFVFLPIGYNFLFLRWSFRFVFIIQIIFCFISLLRVFGWIFLFFLLFFVQFHFFEFSFSQWVSFWEFMPIFLIILILFIQLQLGIITLKPSSKLFWELSTLISIHLLFFKFITSQNPTRFFNLSLSFKRIKFRFFLCFEGFKNEFTSPNPFSTACTPFKH